jgi:hypothetical protein
LGGGFLRDSDQLVGHYHSFLSAFACYGVNRAIIAQKAPEVIADRYQFTAYTHTPHPTRILFLLVSSFPMFGLISRFLNKYAIIVDLDRKDSGTTPFALLLF